ncbi:hypothetical protein DSM25558_4548 [Agrobacterium sp. DSM 25558]|nr:hypothetical protein DSM25558_4548 [Agrobacterium sp. DSM 25558]
MLKSSLDELTPVRSPSANHYIGDDRLMVNPRNSYEAKSARIFARLADLAVGGGPVPVNYDLDSLSVSGPIQPKLSNCFELLSTSLASFYHTIHSDHPNAILESNPCAVRFGKFLQAI